VFVAVKQRAVLVFSISLFLTPCLIEGDEDAHEYIVSVSALRSYENRQRR
jgi:hypothetical protein